MGDHQIDGVYLTPKRLARQRFRHGIISSWDGRCAYCDRPAGTLDHVRARSRGGQSVDRNLVAACGPCNLAKGTEEWRQWFREQEFWCPRREGRIDGWIGGLGQLAA